MDGRCKDCRWWAWPNDPPDANETADCRLFSDWPYFEVQPIEEKPRVQAWPLPFAGADGASLATHADFGCIQWEEKDNGHNDR